MMNNYTHLLGRPFVHGETDCYSLVRDYYQSTFSISLRDYARPNDWWLLDGLDLYRDNFVNEGFYQVDVKTVKDIHKHDLLLIAIPDPRNKNKKTVPNHAAVYVGEGKILHHRLGRSSSVEPYRDAMRNWTAMVLRHKEITVDKLQGPVLFDIKDKLLPHKKALLDEVKPKTF